MKAVTATRAGRGRFAPEFLTGSAVCSMLSPPDVREVVMRRVLATAVAALFMVLMNAAPWAQEPTIKIQGQLVEMSCLTKLGAGKALDDSHIACARDCPPVTPPEAHDPPFRADPLNS